MRRLATAVVLALLLTGSAAHAATSVCHGAPNTEDFRYTWRMRGGLSWVAGFVFPTSGVGQFRNSFANGHVDSSLLITAPGGRGGFYAYESTMDDAARTLTTYHGYAWKNKSRKERTVFDYTHHVARIHKETPDKQWDSNEPLPPETLRDILTAIFYLRQNADSIRGPVPTTIYSDGDAYGVMMRPADRRSFDLDGKSVPAFGFEIVDQPGGRKWPGGVKVWISDDARRIPFRIEIQQSMASMQLELTSVEACGFMGH